MSELEAVARELLAAKDMRVNCPNDVDKHPPLAPLWERLRVALASSPSQPAVRDVIAERQRQVSAEGWTPEHDDEHSGGDLARAAACYALGKDVVTNLGGERVSIWPWEGDGWKPKDSRRNLVRAGALILAEIERLDRAAAPALVEGKK